MNDRNKTIAIIGLLVIVAAIGAGLGFAVRKQMPAASPLPAPVAIETASPAGDPATRNETSTYKDGTYSVDGAYTSPGAREGIGITIVVKDDVITDTSAVSKAASPTGREYQGKFIGGYKAMVVGKKLSEVSLSKVSGSSLTPIGFNDAIKQIRTQAKS